MLGALLALLAALALPLGAVLAEPATLRLVVLDLPYARVWASAVQAMQSYPLERATDGVIETRRVERVPRADEVGAERVAERVTVRVEARGRLATRVTVDVALEGLRDGRWVPLEDDGAAARTILDRIRARLG